MDKMSNIYIEVSFYRIVSEISLVNQLDFVIQAIIFAILIYGYVSFNVYKKFKAHRISFATATIINTASVAILMVPAFISESSDIASDFYELHSLILSIHHIIGLIAGALALYIIARWAFAYKKGSCRGRNLMIATFYLWIFALALGFVLFVIEAV